MSQSRILAASLALGAVCSAQVQLGDLNSDAASTAQSSQATGQFTDQLINYNYGKQMFSGLYAWFTAQGPNGVELYRTRANASLAPTPFDPTDPGSQNVPVLVDVNPGAGSSFPGGLTEYNGFVYFFADSGAGRELHRVGPNFAATPLVNQVLDLNPGALSSSRGDGGPRHDAGSMVVCNGLLYFLVDESPVAGLYQTDGTAGGTTLVKALTPRVAPEFGMQGLDIERRVVATSTHVFFAGDDGGGSGIELWSYETGTATLTEIDINATGDSNPGMLTVIPALDECYFAADDGATGIEPYSSDGTVLGTQQIADVDPLGDSEPNQFFGFPSGAPTHVLFAAEVDGDNDLFSYDFTTVTDLDVNPNSGRDAFVEELIEVVGELYFTASDSSSFSLARQLWKTDGVTATKVTDDTILAGSSSFNSSGVDGGLRAIGPFLFFVASPDPTTEFTVAIFDVSQPAAAGTNPVLLADTSTEVAGDPVFPFSHTNVILTPFGTYLYSNVVDQAPFATTNLGREWLMADISGQTWLLDDIAPPIVGGTRDAEVSSIVRHGSKSYFGALENGDATTIASLGLAVGDYRIWETDGTAGGTNIVAGVPAYVPISGRVPFALGIISYNGVLYFRWSVNGEDDLCSYSPQTGVFTVIDAMPGSNDLENATFTDPLIVGWNGMIYYRSQEDVAVYDPRLPVAPGTNPLYYGQFSEVNNMHVLAGSLWIVGDGANGLELHRSAGVAGDAVDVTDAAINTGVGHSIVNVRQFSSGFLFASDDSGPLAHLGNEILFFANDDPASLIGKELYSFDLTQPASATNPSKVLSGGQPLNGRDLFGHRFLVAHDAAWFYADNNDGSGFELWRYDGSTANVIDVNSGPADGFELTGNISSPVGITDGTGNPAVLFVATDGVRGFELWRTDGLGGPPSIVRDINPGSFDSEIGYKLRSIGERTAVFVARSPVGGLEAWQSDGTTGGTFQLGDIQAASADGAEPFRATIGYVAATNRMIVHGNDGVTGANLFAYDLGATAMPYDNSIAGEVYRSQASPLHRGGCSLAGAPPVMSSNDPALGSAWGVSVEAIPFSIALMMISFQQDPIIAPFLWTNASPCPLYIGIPNEIGSVFEAVPGSGVYQAGYGTVPLDPAVVGLGFSFQAAVLDPAGLPLAIIPGLSFSLSNAIYHTIGF